MMNAVATFTDMIDFPGWYQGIWREKTDDAVREQRIAELEQMLLDCFVQGTATTDNKYDHCCTSTWEHAQAYLLAHGLGKPVKDATTAVRLPAAGVYRVFVRTKDWVARWKASGAPANSSGTATFSSAVIVGMRWKD